MDLGLLKKRYRGNLCLVGHTSVDTLSRGTPEEVDALGEEVIVVSLALLAGHIAGSSNSIAYDGRAENVRAMQHAIFRYGRYPISID